MKNTLSPEYARPGHSGVALGLQNSANQIGTPAGFIIVTVAFLFISGIRAFKAFFLVSAAIAAVSALIDLRIQGHSETDKTKFRFCFRRKYTKYYTPEVFYDARKQVFFTFGPYVLILFYGASTVTIGFLFALSASCCYFAAPLVGRIIDRLGYKVVMISDTLMLVIVCFFYGFSYHISPKNIALIVCCINYILDSVISLASMASNVYVQDISDNKENVRATISIGISVNHLITILIALFGGWIWKVLGVETLFTVSAVLGLCNSAYAAAIKMSAKADTAHIPS